MDVVYFLLPLALLMSGSGLVVFIWALRNGQFEDLEGPRWRILFEERDRP